MSALTAIGLAGWPVGAAAVVWTLVGARAGAARREVIARACHELRGPITAARLGVALMLRGGDSSAAVLRAIDLELSRAGLALDDLLLRRPDEAPESTPAFGSVDVPELLRDCVEAARADAHVRGIRVEAQWSGPERAAWGDRLRLAQAIRNLIANAVEHGGGEVMVRGRGEDETVRIEVVDGGPGLPAPVADLIRRPRGGRGAHGRGLAIAAAIAERHGGRLAAAPSDRGARLVLEVPGAPRSDVADDGGSARRRR